MKLVFFMSTSLFAAKAVVQAADCLGVAQTEIPSCAQSCFVENAPSVGCDGTDFICQCQNEATLYAAIESCVASGCPEPSFQAVIDGASSVCNCATANPDAFAIGTSLASFALVATVTGSSTATGSVPSAVPVSATGTAISTPTGIGTSGTTSTSPTPSASQGIGPNSQSDLRFSYVTNAAFAVILSILVF
ncbi:hypothetical protein F5Y13DRAFT_132032 [Hypoxylon sp. FL1857]|nr:hypothetical protein F5Y13DRAFT_132032 [Hypoxylon sp. FL1857]